MGQCQTSSLPLFLQLSLQTLDIDGTEIYCCPSVSGKELMRSLESETDINTGWINNGGLFVAMTKARLDEYKRLNTVCEILSLYLCLSGHLCVCACVCMCASVHL